MVDGGRSEAWRGFGLVLALTLLLASPATSAASPRRTYRVKTTFANGRVNLTLPAGATISRAGISIAAEGRFATVYLRGMRPDTPDILVQQARLMGRWQRIELGSADIAVPQRQQYQLSVVADGPVRVDVPVVAASPPTVSTLRPRVGEWSIHDLPPRRESVFYTTHHDAAKARGRLAVGALAYEYASDEYLTGEETMCFTVERACSGEGQPTFGLRTRAATGSIATYFPDGASREARLRYALRATARPVRVRLLTVYIDRS